MTVTGSWFDVDYFTFSNGSAQCTEEPCNPSFVGAKFDVGHSPAVYGIYDVSGMFLGRIEAAGLADVRAKTAGLVRNGGMFIAKPLRGGQMFRFTVTK